MCVGGGATACVGNITNAERLGNKALEEMQGPVFPRCQGKSVASKCEAVGDRDLQDQAKPVRKLLYEDLARPAPWTRSPAVV